MDMTRRGFIGAIAGAALLRIGVPVKAAPAPVVPATDPAPRMWMASGGPVFFGDETRITLHGRERVTSGIRVTDV